MRFTLRLAGGFAANRVKWGGVEYAIEGGKDEGGRVRRGLKREKDLTMRHRRRGAAMEKMKAKHVHEFIKRYVVSRGRISGLRTMTLVTHMI